MQIGGRKPSDCAFALFLAEKARFSELTAAPVPKQCSVMPFVSAAEQARTAIFCRCCEKISYYFMISARIFFLRGLLFLPINYKISIEKDFCL